MSLPSEVKSLFNALIGSQSVRRVVIPAGAPIAIVSDGAAAANAYAAWVQIVAAGVITDPSWFGGVTLLNNDLEAAAFADLNIGSGAGGAEVSLAEYAYFNEIAAVAASNLIMLDYPLMYPIRVTGTPRIAGRIRKSSAASAKGITPKVTFYTAVGL